MIPAGSSVEVPVNFDATDLELGTYTGNITIVSDPDVGLVVVPVTMIVGASYLSIPFIEAVQGPVSVPVHADAISNMGSFQFTIEYDASHLIYTGTSYWYPGITGVMVANPSAGKLTYEWTSSTGGISIPSGDFFNLNFTFDGTISYAVIRLSDDPTPREFADVDGNIFMPVYSNGFVVGPTEILENGITAVRVFPNPASEVITVKSDFAIKGLEVLSYLGQRVYTGSYSGDKEVQLRVSGLPSGIYFMKVQTEKGVGMVKVTVEH